MKSCFLITSLFIFLSSTVFSQCPVGSIIYYMNQSEIDNFPTLYPDCDEFPSIIHISGPSIISLAGFQNITSSNGLSIYDCDNLLSLYGFSNLDSVYGSVRIYENVLLNNIDALNGIQYVSVSLYLANLSSLEEIAGFSELEHVGGRFMIENNDTLNSINGFDNLTNISEYFYIRRNPNLSNVIGFSNLDRIGRWDFWENASLDEVIGFEQLEYIEDFMWFDDNLVLTSIPEFISLDSINGRLMIDNNPQLTDLSGLENLSYINGDLQIINNDNLESLVGLNAIGIDSISELIIKDNDLLFNCAIESVCNFINLDSSITDITINAEGCNTEEEVEISCIGLGIEEVDSMKFSVYPNPTSTFFTIEIEGERQIDALRMYSQLGKLVLEEKNGNNSIDVSEMTCGIYFVEIRSGESITRQKIIIR